MHNHVGMIVFINGCICRTASAVLAWLFNMICVSIFANWFIVACIVMLSETTFGDCANVGDWFEIVETNEEKQQQQNKQKMLIAQSTPDNWVGNEILIWKKPFFSWLAAVDLHYLPFACAIVIKQAHVTDTNIFFFGRHFQKNHRMNDSAKKAPGHSLMGSCLGENGEWVRMIRQIQTFKWLLEGREKLWWTCHFGQMASSSPHGRCHRHRHRHRVERRTERKNVNK